MVRFLVMYNRPLDPVDFERHYRDIHIPLARRLPGLRRYTLSRDAAAVRGDEPYYLVAELDWDDMPALERAFRSAEGQATAQDVPTFATGGVRSMVFELDEVELLGTPPD